MFMNFKTFFFFLSREVSVSLSAKVLHYVHQLLGSCVYLLLDEEQVEYSGFTGCVLLKTELKKKHCCFKTLRKSCCVVFMTKNKTFHNTL